MTLDVFLCDAAVVREGLLHILGAGVTRIYRPNYPAQLSLRIAMLMTLKPTEAREPHKLRIVLQDEDGHAGAQLDGQFGVAQVAGLRPGEDVCIPLVLDLQPIQIAKAGTYSIEILIDSQHMRSLPFTAVQAESPLRPPALPGPGGGPPAF